MAKARGLRHPALVILPLLIWSCASASDTGSDPAATAAPTPGTYNVVTTTTDCNGHIVVTYQYVPGLQGIIRNNNYNCAGAEAPASANPGDGIGPGSSRVTNNNAPDSTSSSRAGSGGVINNNAPDTRGGSGAGASTVTNNNRPTSTGSDPNETPDAAEALTNGDYFVKPPACIWNASAHGSSGAVGPAQVKHYLNATNGLLASAIGCRNTSANSTVAFETITTDMYATGNSSRLVTKTRGRTTTLIEYEPEGFIAFEDAGGHASPDITQLYAAFVRNGSRRLLQAADVDFAPSIGRREALSTSDITSCPKYFKLDISDCTQSGSSIEYAEPVVTDESSGVQLAITKVDRLVYKVDYCAQARLLAIVKLGYDKLCQSVLAKVVSAPVALDAVYKAILAAKKANLSWQRIQQVASFIAKRGAAAAEAALSNPALIEASNTGLQAARNLGIGAEGAELIGAMAADAALIAEVSGVVATAEVLATISAGLGLATAGVAATCLFQDKAIPSDSIVIKSLHVVVVPTGASAAQYNPYDKTIPDVALHSGFTYGASIDLQPSARVCLDSCTSSPCIRGKRLLQAGTCAAASSMLCGPVPTECEACCANHSCSCLDDGGPDTPPTCPCSCFYG